jgi:hypothetical protein
MEQNEKEKNPVGRPRTPEDKKLKSYHYKAEADLIPVLDKVENRNGFINAAVREKAEREGLMK